MNQEENIDILTDPAPNYSSIRYSYQSIKIETELNSFVGHCRQHYGLSYLKQQQLSCTPLININKHN